MHRPALIPHQIDRVDHWRKACKLVRVSHAISKSLSYPLPQNPAMSQQNDNQFFRPKKRFRNHRASRNQLSVKRVIPMASKRLETKSKSRQWCSVHSLCSLMSSWPIKSRIHIASICTQLALWKHSASCVFVRFCSGMAR